MHSDLFQQLCQLAKRHHAPCALHLAESRDELELLESATGPLQQMLESLGVWNPSAIARGLAPLDYLQPMSELPRSLIIHGNFLTAAEIKFLGQQADRMSLIYCPRTYSHFNDTSYPLSAMLEQGVLVALGTDSRATNPDLSLLAEMQHVGQAHPTIAPDLIVQMGTRHGARALGLENVCGSIEPGKRADLVTICTDQRENPVGFIGVGGPDFLTVYQPMIALVLAFGLDTGQIRPGTRLGIALTPADFTAGDRGQIMQFLFMRAKVQQGGPKHPDAKALQRVARLDPVHLFFEDLFLRAVQAGAAILGRPDRCGPALLTHPLQPELALGILEGLAPTAPNDLVILHRGPHGGRAIFLQPGARFRPESVQCRIHSVCHHLSPLRQADERPF